MCRAAHYIVIGQAVGADVTEEFSILKQGLEKEEKKSGSRIVITFYNPLFPVSNAGAAALEPPLL